MRSATTLALSLLAVPMTAIVCNPSPPPTYNNFNEGTLTTMGPSLFATTDPDDGFWSPLPHDEELPTSTALMVTCPEGATSALDEMAVLYSSMNGNLTRDEALATPNELLCARVCSPYWPENTGLPLYPHSTCTVQKPSCPSCQPETQQVHVNCHVYFHKDDPINLCQEDCPDGYWCLAQWVSVPPQ